MIEFPDLQPRNDTATCAIEFMNGGDFCSAVESWDQYLATHPGVADAWVARGLSKASLGDADGMLSDYESAWKVAPDDQRICRLFHFTLGGALYCTYLEEGDVDLLEQSIEHFDLAASAAPDDLEVRSYRGTALVHAQRFEQARADFSRMIEVMPESAYARLMRGLIALQSGELASAKEDLESAIEHREQLDAELSQTLDENYAEVIAQLTAV